MGLELVVKDKLTCSLKMTSPCVSVVLGGQWGDEGKGKIVDVLARDADLVCRCQVCRNIFCSQKSALII